MLFLCYAGRHLWMNIMNQVQFAAEDEDDMYSGFNDYNATLDTQVWKFITNKLMNFALTYLFKHFKYQKLQQAT